MTIDLRQAPSARTAIGTFTVTDRRSQVTLEMGDVGVLQAAGRWAAFTGRARLRPSGDEQSFSVIVDRQAPLAPGRTTVVVDIGSAYHLGGTLTP